MTKNVKVCICPNCLKEVLTKKREEVEVLVIRNENVSVNSSYLECTECGFEFDDVESKFDITKEAYRVYRDKKNFIQPEDIKKFRKQLGLTQIELATSLGWGEVTISRYEKGALQDDAHDSSLQAAMTREGFLALLKKKPNVVSSKKLSKVNEWISSGVLQTEIKNLKYIIKSQKAKLEFFEFRNEVTSREITTSRNILVACHSSKSFEVWENSKNNTFLTRSPKKIINRLKENLAYRTIKIKAKC